MSAIIVNSDESLQRLLGTVREAYIKHRFLRVTLKTGKDRSLDFNAISHVWYGQLSRELPEDDALGWKSYCKLHFGVPILRAEDEQFRDFYDAAIRTTLSYEQKLSAMKYMPVSSLMTNPQFKIFCEAMQSYFMKLGVDLQFPEDDNKK